MSGGRVELQIEWVVACLAPHDIAPHPNFSTEAVRGPELLALLTSFSWREYFAFVNSAKESEIDKDPRMASEIIGAAQEALDSETTLLGAEKLERLALDGRLSYGERVAAGLLAAVAFSELDQPERAIPFLDKTSSSLGSEISDGPSRCLAQSALWQQCGLRALEAGEIGRARTYARLVVELTATVGADWDDFEVSRGISWNAAESQQRLIEQLRGNAESLLVTTGDPADDAWTEIVRAPAPVATIRPTRDALSGLTSFVEETFDSRLTSRKRSLRFGGGDIAAGHIYSSLLNAELTGDLGASSRYRSVLGNVLALRALSGDSQRISTYSEALRLLRQADSDERLGRLIDVMRRQGPLEVLKHAAELLIATRSKQSFITSSDLLLLRRTADLVGDEFTVQAIPFALRFCRQVRDGRLKGSRSVDWRRIEVALNALADLISGNPSADMDFAAKAALQMLPDVEAASDQFVFRALAKVSDSLAWERVTPSTRAEWAETVSAALQRPDVLAIDALRLLADLNLPADSVMSKPLDGLEFVTSLVGGVLADPPNEHDLDKAGRIVGEMLTKVVQDAKRGQFTTYTWSPFALAAYLISRHARLELWPQLVSALANPLVLKDSKVHALEILTDDFRRVDFPTELLTANPIPTSAENSSFFPMSTEYFASVCRNFYLAAQVISPAEAQAGILRDSGSGDSETRVEAARGSSLASIIDPSLEWPTILLLQASHDSDSLVANSGARYLGYLSATSSIALRATVDSRVEALLRDRGLALPMGVLNGIAGAIRESKTVDVTRLPYYDLLISLRAVHPSRIIRIGCEKILDGQVDGENRASPGSS